MVEHNGTHSNGLSRKDRQRLVDFTEVVIAPATRRAATRRVWGIDLDTWVSYLTATNVMGKTQFAPEILGKPLELARAKDGSIRFNDSGKPIVRVRKDISSFANNARDKYASSLQAYTGLVMGERPEAFKDMVGSSQQAAAPLYEQETLDLAEATAMLEAALKAAQATPQPAPANIPDSMPAPEPVGVA